MKNWTGYRQAIEENLTIIDKDKKEVPFILNPPQLHFLENAIDRNVILKARKMGFCVDPSTRVLTADLRWVRVDELAVGAEIVATDEEPLPGRGQSRSLRKGVVEAKAEVREEAFLIKFENGQTIIATGKHRFLYMNGTKNPEWRAVEKMKPGAGIRYVTQPWGEPTMEDAWFAGILDGEGSLRAKSSGGTEVRVVQNTGPVWDRMLAYAEASGLSFNESYDKRGVRNFKHGMITFARTNELFELVGKTRATRFLAKEWWQGRGLPGKRSGKAWQKILSVESLGKRKMIDLQTSTSTFIAEGFVSHNSSVLLAIAVIKFILGKNEKCVSMSFDKDASAKQLDRAKHFVGSYERINKIKMNFKYNSKNEMVWGGTDENGDHFTNALRIGTAKSSSFGRGDDISFLHLTEVSSADNLEYLLAGVGEALVRDSMLTMETTANGYNEFKTFWDEAVTGDRGYKALFYEPSWEYDETYLNQKKKELGRLYDQEYPSTPELAFIATGDNYFDKLAIQDYLAKVKDKKAQEGTWRRYRKYQKGEFIVAFADTAAGGGDYCAVQFLSKDHLDVPVIYHSKTIATEMTPELHAELERIYDQTGVKPVIAYERNNGGVFELERLVALNRLQKYTVYRQKRNVGTKVTTTDSPKYGWDTNTATRPAMLGMLKDAIDNQLIQIYDRPTINEMFSFVEVRTTSGWKAQAESSAHDDLIMSLAGVWQLYQTEEKPKDRRFRLPKKKNWAHLQSSRSEI